MKKLLMTFFVTSMFLVYGCKGSESKTAPRPNPKVVDTQLCGAAGRNLEKYGCIHYDNFTKRGLNFGEFCSQTQENQIWLNPKCLSEIQPKDMMQCRDMINDCTYSK